MKLKLKINWEHKRVKHAIERMWLRGISTKEIEMAILRGKKVIQKKTGLVETFHSYYSIVYDEKILGGRIRKIYPVTVKIW